MGDSAYIIDANNTDRYPLMKPYAGPHDIGIVNLSTSRNRVVEGQDLNVNVEILVALAFS